MCWGEEEEGTGVLCRVAECNDRKMMTSVGIASVAARLINLLSLYSEDNIPQLLVLYTAKLTGNVRIRHAENYLMHFSCMPLWHSVGFSACTVL